MLSTFGRPRGIEDGVAGVTKAKTTCAQQKQPAQPQIARPRICHLSSCIVCRDFWRSHCWVVQAESCPNLVPPVRSSCCVPILFLADDRADPGLERESKIGPRRRLADKIKIKSLKKIFTRYSALLLITAFVAL